MGISLFANIVSNTPLYGGLPSGIQPASDFLASFGVGTRITATKPGRQLLNMTDVPRHTTPWTHEGPKPMRNP